MNENLITKAYEMAKERYAAIGVDTDKAIELLEKTPISLQCWQADDVMASRTTPPSQAESRRPATTLAAPATSTSSAATSSS